MPIPVSFMYWEPSFLLLPTALVLNASANGSSDAYKLFTLFVICNAILTFIASRMTRPPMTVQILASVIVSTVVFGFIASHFQVLKCCSLMSIRIISGLIAVYSARELPSKFSPSFSPGELCIVIQGLVSFLAISLVTLSTYYIGGGSFETSTPCKVIQILTVALTLFLASIQVASPKSNSSPVIPVAFAGCIIWAYACLLNFLSNEPITWLFNELVSTPVRQKLLTRWSICLGTTVLFTLGWSKLASNKASSPQRKLFHIPVVYVFVTGVKEDIQFLSFTSACLLVIFLVIEGIRLTKSNRLASTIEFLFDCFRDEKDFGPLTLTHIYLLIGCAFPVWLACGGDSFSSFAACSGAISIGLGDSAASIVGSLWGRRKWPRNKKSYEGTGAAFVAQVIGSVLLLAYLDPGKILTIGEFLVICITSLIVSLIEALTNEIDNLVLPLYFNIILLAIGKVTSLHFS